MGAMTMGTNETYTTYPESVSGTVLIQAPRGATTYTSQNLGLTTNTPVTLRVK